MEKNYEGQKYMKTNKWPNCLKTGLVINLMLKIKKINDENIEMNKWPKMA